MPILISCCNFTRCFINSCGIMSKYLKFHILFWPIHFQIKLDFIILEYWSCKKKSFKLLWVILFYFSGEIIHQWLRKLQTSLDFIHQQKAKVKSLYHFFSKATYDTKCLSVHLKRLKENVNLSASIQDKCQ